MVRWIEIDVNSYWDPNRFIPHSGLFEGLLGSERVMIHSWAEKVPKGLAFCTKSVGKIDLSRIPQKHLFIREQYMFWLHDKGDLVEIDLDATRRFFAGCVASNKLVYLPFFRIPPGHHFSNIIHTEKWLEFQDFVSSEFAHEFYFDYNAHVGRAACIKALRRQINIDDLL
jgi:hypothetical protein